MPNGRKQQQNPYTRKNFRDWNKKVTINQNWAAWLDTFRNKLVRIIDPDVREAKGGPDVILYWPSHFNGHANFSINLTDHTEEELNALQVFLNESINLARPVARLRDEAANAANAKGDDSDPRVYRSLPRLVVRPWAVGLDPAGILFRLEDALKLRSTQLYADNTTGELGEHMAEGKESDGGSEDDSSEDYFDPGIRELGR